MRASEFINESYKPGKISKRQRYASKGMHKFRDPDGYDRTYEMNRIGMALACTDGEIVPEIDQESWAGRFNTAHPYTEVEAKMLKKAYQAMGTSYKDLNHGDLKSDEVPSTNITSPVKPFKGYKK